jgi:hypothetical protein
MRYKIATCSSASNLVQVDGFLDSSHEFELGNGDPSLHGDFEPFVVLGDHQTLAVAAKNNSPVIISIL